MPEPSSSGQRGGSKWLSIAECVAITVIYIVVSLGGLKLFDVSVALTWLTDEEASVISGFIVGSLSQIGAIVLIWFVLRPVDLERSMAAIRSPSNAEGWTIALVIIGIEAVVMFSFFLDVGWQAVKPSAINLTGSIGPLLDGVTQEVFFRGYLILRLMRGGHGLFIQLLFSSLAFSAIHIGYMGENWTDALPPLLGTTGLGFALGWAFVRGGYSLRPPIVAHAAILILVQPWLALGR